MIQMSEKEHEDLILELHELRSDKAKLESELALSEGRERAASAEVTRVRQQGQEAYSRLETKLREMEQRKDGAYLERNRVVAALAKVFPSGVARTAIEGWSEDWHGCVYIDLPTGQASWHFHDSQAYLFDGLPQYQGTWDGHSTEEKYRRVAELQYQDCMAVLAALRRIVTKATFSDDHERTLLSIRETAEKVLDKPTPRCPVHDTALNANGKCFWCERSPAREPEKIKGCPCPHCTPPAGETPLEQHVREQAHDDGFDRIDAEREALYRRHGIK